MVSPKIWAGALVLVVGTTLVACGGSGGAATPEAAASAARMAALVRSTSAATISRVQSSTVNNTSGDRVLNYHATVREQADRTAVLAALAMEDMLHRPVMSGG